MPYPVLPPEPPPLILFQDVAPAASSTIFATPALNPPGNNAYVLTRGNRLSPSGQALMPRIAAASTSADFMLPRSNQAAQLGPPQTLRLPVFNRLSDDFVLAQTPESSTPTTPVPPRAAPTDQISGVVELTADRQEYDEERRVFRAEGNVIMRFRGALLDADRLQVNLPNRLAVAEGQVALTRGEQVLRGDRFEYNFVQGSGTVFNARGEVYQPTLNRDLTLSPTADTTVNTVLDRPLSDRLIRNQPSQVSSPGDLSINLGAGRDASPTLASGEVRRLRFEADRLDFTPEGWQARNIRITNDPFSPPELELRANEARFSRTSATEQVLETSQPQLVFDQGFALPVLRSRAVFGRQQSNGGLLNLGYDGGDRGGLFVEQTVDAISTNQIQFSFTPQFFIQRAVEVGFTNPTRLFGLIGKLDAGFGPTTSLRGSAVLTSLDFSQIESNLRASLRLRQLVAAHTLSVEYSYRDRLFNGSLGFQDVQSTFGAILTSPVIQIGNTGVYLNYQAGLQSITADTDRSSLLAPIRANNRVSLSRFQASAEVSRSFTLWQGQGLPATATQGLRYSSTPVVPYLQVTAALRGVAGVYSNGDNQETLTGNLSLQGQFGNFSRPFFDYTGFNIGYSQTARTGLSPFLFDRAVDNRVLSGGIIQQIYGPLRVGFQTSINLDTSKEISTDYILEYSRRTYGVTLRYNPILQIGSLGLRISDFNWDGGTDPFSNLEISPVENGVRRLPEER